MKAFGSKAFAVATASVLHIAVLAAITARLVDDEGGGAPVIHVSLEPMPSFDGTDGAQADSAEAEGGGGGGQSGAADVLRPVTEAVQAEAPKPAASNLSAPRRPVIPDLSSLEPSPFSAVSGGGAPASRAAPGQTGPQGGSGGEADTRAGSTSGSGAPTLGATAQDAEDRYGATILAWIERHKRHPGGDLSGLVGVAITLDRSGRLRDVRVTRSSGSGALDRTALDQLQAMQPFPRPPAGTRWTRRGFDVQIDYRLR